MLGIINIYGCCLLVHESLSLHIVRCEFEKSFVVDVVADIQFVEFGSLSSLDLKTDSFGDPAITTLTTATTTINSQFFAYIAAAERRSVSYSCR